MWVEKSIMYIYNWRGVILYNILVGCNKRMLWWFLEMCDVLGFEIDRNGVMNILGSALPRDILLGALAKKYKANHKCDNQYTFPMVA